VRFDSAGRPPTKFFAIDAIPPAIHSAKLNAKHYSTLVRHIVLLYSLLGQQKIGYLKSRIQGRWRTLKHMLSKNWLKTSRAMGWGIPEHKRNQFLMYTELELLQKYNPSKYAGKVTLICSDRDPDWKWLKPQAGQTQRLFSPLSALERWKTIADSVDLIETPGDHVSLFKGKNAMHLATIIRGKS
jgi:hypothetical protein